MFGWGTLGGYIFALPRHIEWRGYYMRMKPDITEEWLKKNDPDYGKNNHYMNNDRFLKVLRWEKPTDRMDKIKRGACV